MAKIDDVKKRIAEVLKVSDVNISDEFVIKTGRFNTSAGSVILNNIVRKVYGICVEIRDVKTFGDLRTLLDGGGFVESTSEAANISELDAENDCFDASSEYSGRLVCGVDIQEVDIFPIVDDYWTEPFYTENFSSKEIAYCITAASPVLSFAGRWCVKEALHKCGKKYYNIPLKNIQVMKRNDGLLEIEILDSEGEWRTLSLSCSISHDKRYAVGMVTGFDGR